MINWNRIFEYRDGNLYWKVSAGKRKAGSRAGNVGGKGYRRVGYNYKLYPEHRVIWELHNGSIPDGLEIDHINRVRSDNRIENLRLATSQENKRNTSSNGFHYEKVRGKFLASINVGDQRKWLGTFDNKLDARAAYLRARKELFGEFA